MFSVYWICVCISTVGYGDYTGGTLAEYFVSIILEFVGLIIFSILMYLVTEVAQLTHNQSGTPTDQISDLDQLILELQKCNDWNHLSPILFFEMKKSLEDQYALNNQLLVKNFQFY